MEFEFSRPKLQVLNSMTPRKSDNNNIKIQLIKTWVTDLEVIIMQPN